MISESATIIWVRWAKCVQVVFGSEQRDQIKRARAVEIIRLRSGSADARGPPIGIVKYEQSHSRRPRTVKGRRLFDDQVPKFIGRLEEP